MKREEYRVDVSARLDSFLTNLLAQTRSQTAQLIKKGYVSVNGKRVTKSGYKLKVADQLSVEFPDVIQTQEQYSVDFDVEILYEDDALLVINKPSGVVVHGAPSVKEATLVDWLKQKGVSLSTISGEERHGIVHRLDKGTSGVMVVAKTNDAHKKLSAQLEDKSMGRYYLAVITPPLKDELCIVEKPIGRNPKNRLKMGCVSGGKEAKTAFLMLDFSKDEKEELIACKLFSGRTHQIRVHLESMSRHIIGDELYRTSNSKSVSEQILLHAYIIYFNHPVTGKRMQISAMYDERFKNYLEKKFQMEKIDEKIVPQCIIERFDTLLS